MSSSRGEFPNGTTNDNQDDGSQDLLVHPENTATYEQVIHQMKKTKNDPEIIAQEIAFYQPNTLVYHGLTQSSKLLRESYDRLKARKAELKNAGETGTESVKTDEPAVGETGTESVKTEEPAVEVKHSKAVTWDDEVLIRVLPTMVYTYISAGKDVFEKGEGDKKIYRVLAKDWIPSPYPRPKNQPSSIKRSQSVSDLPTTTSPAMTQRKFAELIKKIDRAHANISTSSTNYSDRAYKALIKLEKQEFISQSDFNTAITKEMISWALKTESNSVATAINEINATFHNVKNQDEKGIIDILPKQQLANNFSITTPLPTVTTNNKSSSNKKSLYNSNLPNKKNLQKNKSTMLSRNHSSMFNENEIRISQKTVRELIPHVILNRTLRRPYSTASNLRSLVNDYPYGITYADFTKKIQGFMKENRIKEAYEPNSPAKRKLNNQAIKAIRQKFIDLGTKLEPIDFQRPHKK